MTAGAIISWFGLMPLIASIGSMGEIIIYPASVPTSELGHWGIWNYYIRYVGAGAVAFDGIYNLLKTTPLIVQTFKESMKDYSSNLGGGVQERTNKDGTFDKIVRGFCKTPKETKIDLDKIYSKNNKKT